MAEFLERILGVPFRRFAATDPVKFRKFYCTRADSRHYYFNAQIHFTLAEARRPINSIQWYLATEPSLISYAITDFEVYLRRPLLPMRLLSDQRSLRSRSVIEKQRSKTDRLSMLRAVSEVPSGQGKTNPSYAEI